MSAATLAARPVNFRFGLTGRRWGNAGPTVLLLRGGEATSTSLAAVLEPLLASGRQVVALDDPTDAGLDEAARVGEYAVAALEAAVELPELEFMVGEGLGAAAAAQAQAMAPRLLPGGSSPPS